MAFKMKGSPFKQAILEGENKISGRNTKKAKNKPKEKTVTDFTSEGTSVNNPFDTSNKDRTWKDFHNAEKGAALFVGSYMVPSQIANIIRAYKKK